MTAQAECERQLNELRESALFAADFPRRIGYTHAQLAALSKQEARDPHRPALVAIERIRSSHRHLVGLVDSLGRARYEPAIAVLTKLWRDCALVPVRDAAGHALFAMQTDEARSALESMIEDSDHLSTFLGARAVLDRDFERAFGRLKPYFEEQNGQAPEVGRQVLALLAPGHVVKRDGSLTSVWMEPRMPEWLKRDPRWLELCAELRHSELFGHDAREVLRHADPSSREAALDKVRKRESPRAIVRHMQRRGNLLARYKSGEFAAVWREIGSHEAIGGDYMAEAGEVADETMKRVARNVDLLAEGLAAAGWQPLYGELRTIPDPQDHSTIERIESITGGSLPLSLRSFWSAVGGIDWVWNYKSGDAMPNLGVDLPMDEMDPLCIEPPKLVGYLLEEWEDQKRQPDPDLVGLFNLDLAPDYLHKANISGGAPYGIQLPCLKADPLFTNERHNLTFTNYLRLCFRWAGFPGLEDHSDRKDVQRFVATFGRDMEPF